jgi:hypothetical protein
MPVSLACNIKKKTFIEHKNLKSFYTPLKTYDLMNQINARCIFL